MIRSASIYLSHVGFSVESIQEARVLLDPAVAGLAAQRASKDDLNALGATLGALLAGGGPLQGARGLHEQIADLGGNRALALFMRVTIAAAWGESPRPALPEGAPEAIRASEMRIVAAIQQRDAEQARDLMQAHAELTVEWWAAIHSIGLGDERA